jgi:hypothetical protein
MRCLSGAHCKDRELRNLGWDLQGSLEAGFNQAGLRGRFAVVLGSWSETGFEEVGGLITKSQLAGQ